MKTINYFSKLFFVTLLLIFLVPASAQIPDSTKGNGTVKASFSTQILGKMREGQYSLILDSINLHRSAKVIVQLVPPNIPPDSHRKLSKIAFAKMREKGIKQRLDTFVSKMNLQASNRVRQFIHIPFLALEIDETLLGELIQADEVLSIREDRIHRLNLDASIPQVKADVVWNEGYTGINQTIAILDTGVDANHVFFADSNAGSKVVSEACYSTTYGPDSATALCLDGSTLPGAGSNCTGLSGCSHGTHVAGIAAGKGDGFSGVAKGASLVSIQVFSRFDDPEFCDSSSCIAAFTSDIIQGLERVYSLVIDGTYSISSVNLSLGGGGVTNVSECDADDLGTKQIIDQLRSVGVATVIASGNGSFIDKISSPGCISSAISVGAINSFNNVAGFSNSASWLTLLAPGTSIFSSIPNNSFSSLSGTSMAAPHVAGSFALLKSKMPLATVDQLLAALVNTGMPVTDSGNGIVTPRISLDRASEVLGFSVLPANIILDNDFDGIGVQGQFNRVLESQSYNGSALEAISSGMNTFRFSPTFPQPGNYRVYGWWPASINNNTEVVFTVKHGDGDTQINVDQQANGSQWYELGVFFFSQNIPAYVEISGSNSPAIVADAVRFEFVALNIDTGALPSGSAGAIYSYNLEASDGLLPFSWDILMGTLPSGIILQPDGTISGVPSQVETNIFTVQVTDGMGNTAVQTLTLSVDSNTSTPLHIETASLVDGLIGTPYSANLVASGGTAPYTWNVVSGSLPVGLSLQSDGYFSGTPSLVETRLFTVQATDNLGNTSTQALSLMITSSTNLTFEDDFESGTLAPWGQLQSGSVQLFNDPAFGWVLRKTGNNDPHGGWAPLGSELNDFEFIVYTRKPHTAGENSIRYSVTDSNGNGYGIRLNTPSGLFTIKKRTAWKGSTVGQSGVLPNMTLNQWYTIRFARQGDTLSAAAYLGRVDPAQANPIAQITTSNRAYHSFTQVNVNGGYDFDTDNVRIKNLAVAPALSVGNNILSNGTVNVLYMGNLVASGGTSPYTWDIISGTLPDGLSLQNNGSISGMPTLAEERQFTVEVTDTVGSTVTQSLSLTIDPVASTPLNIETASLVDGLVGTPYSANLVASGGTSPYIWNVVSGSLPVGLSLQSNGHFSGAPSLVETRLFTVQATDNLGNTSTQALSLMITSSTNLTFEDDFESGTLAPWGQLQSGSIQLFNDPAFGWVLRKTGNNDPHGGWAPLGAELNDFEFIVYTRKPHTAGENSIRYSVTDSNGNGYGIRLNTPSGLFTIKKRTAWKGSTVGQSGVLPNMTLNQWYTIRFARQGDTLSAAAYLGRVDPAQANPIAQITTSNRAYHSFTQVNVNGGYDFDTDNVRIKDLAF